MGRAFMTNVYLSELYGWVGDDAEAMAVLTRFSANTVTAIDGAAALPGLVKGAVQLTGDGVNFARGLGTAAEEVAADAPKLLPPPLYEVPEGFAATGRYTADGRPIFSDGNGGLVAPDPNAAAGAGSKIISVDQSDLPLIGDWTATKAATAPENALRHWNDHGAEFPQYTNASEYVQAAQDFVNNPPSGSLTKVRPGNGDQLFYDPATNTFVSATANGVPRTMFKPSAGMSYWNRQ